jgi:hypothetical protein
VIFRLASLAGGLLHRLLRETRGSIALKFALIVPAVSMLSVGAVDLMAVTSAQTRLQALADAGALASAPALALATDGAAARERAASFVAAELSQWPDAPTVVGTYEIVERGGQRGIRVLLRANRPSFFANMLPPGGWNFEGDATATSVGLVPLCVLDLATAGERKLFLDDSSRLEAPKCLVHSNNNIEAAGSGWLIGEAIQAVRSAIGNIAPKAGTGAAPIEDPFAKLPIDEPDGGCRPIEKKSTSIAPGIHCGGKLTGATTYRLLPGEHWLMGDLNLAGTATLEGTDVVLLFGRNGSLSFSGNARVNLTGRERGDYAGIVMAVSRDFAEDTLTLDSSRIDRLEGVIYVPNTVLQINSKKSADVARQSAWTVIVAAGLVLTGSPNVFINANYGDSDVPVPGGVGPNAGGASRGGPRLIQ